MKKILPPLICLFMLAAKSFSQTNEKLSHLIHTPVRDKDSLEGFDEPLMKQVAFSEGFYDDEYDVFMARAKRDYVIDKYHLPVLKHELFSDVRSKVAMATCMNEDFESSPAGSIPSSSSVSGWSVFGGLNTNTGGSCSHLGCCTVSTPTAMIINTTGGYIDSYIGSSYPIYSVFGNTANGGSSWNPSIPNMSGNSIIRLNDQAGNYTATMLSKTFSVTPSNTLFEYAYIAMVYSGHTCCDAPAFTIKLYNASAGNTLIACPTVTVAGPPSVGGCTVNPVPMTSFTVTTSGYYYNHWQLSSFDLSPYIGSLITIEIIATDCTAAGHFCYLYFDAQCSTASPPACACVPSGTVTQAASCGTGSVTLSGTTGLGPYLWNGPSSFTSSAQTITTSTPGTYTLTMSNSSQCANAVQVYSVIMTPPASLSVNSSDTMLCLGNTVTLTASGAVNYSWSTGSTNTLIAVSPSVNTTYTVTGTDANGCASSSTFMQVVTACTEVNNPHNNTLFAKLYPNPNKGEFILELNNKILNGELVVKNMLGQTVHIQTVAGGKNQIITKNLPAGIYIYSVIENKRSLYKGKIQVE